MTKIVQMLPADVARTTQENVFSASQTFQQEVDVDGDLSYPGTYGELYIAAVSASQVIPSGSSWTKITAWTDEGAQSNTEISASDGQIKVLKTGRYLLAAALSIASDTNNVVVDYCAHLNGSPLDNLVVRRKIAVAGDVGALSVTGAFNAAASSIIDLRIRHDNAGDVDLTILSGNVNITYLGE